MIEFVGHTIAMAIALVLFMFGPFLMVTGLFQADLCFHTCWEPVHSGWWYGVSVLGLLETSAIFAFGSCSFADKRS